MKILIAEDNPTTRRMLTLVIEEMGYTPVIATNGLDAIDILSAKEGAPRIAMIDMAMPDLEGDEVCRLARLRVTGAYPYLIIHSAADSEASRTRARAAGCNEFLPLPPEMDELRFRLKSAEQIIRKIGGPIP